MNRGGALRRHPVRGSAVRPGLQTESDASLELDVVRALTLGRDGVILTEEVHLGLRADRESHAGAEIEAELRLRILHLSSTVRLILEGHAVQTRTTLREEARAHLRAEVHPQRRVDTDDAGRKRSVRRRSTVVQVAEVVPRRL